MAELIPNSFTSWELDPEEELRGTIFDGGQVKVLQNQQAVIAEEKLALMYDPANPHTFAQDEAYMRGQLDIISYILDASNSAVDELPKLLNPNPEL